MIAGRVREIPNKAKLMKTYTDRENELMENLGVQKASNENLKEKCYQCKYEIVCGGWCRYKKDVYGEYCPFEELEKNDMKMIFECI